MTHELQYYPFKAMGCHMQILIAGDGDHQRAVSLVVDTFAYAEDVLSRFRPDSEINRLHRAAGQWQACSPTLWNVLQLADWAYTYSDGLIDPTIRTALEAHGYDRPFTELAPTDITAPITHIPWQAIQRDEARQRILLPAGARIDLAGVAKSWTAQTAIALLHDFPAAAIDAAGDIVCHGTPPGDSAWPVDIVPLSEGADAPIVALNAQRSIATSGRDQRHWRQHDGTRAHHIIDPRTQAPAHSDVVRASVIAPTLVQADVTARMLVIMGVDAGIAWLARHPECAAVMQTTSAQSVMSRNWHEFVWSPAL